MKVSVGITAVAERRDLANKLVVSLGNTPNIRILYDLRRKGVWWNTRRAWLAYAEDATHHIAMEEDVIPCKDFMQTAERIAELLPEHIITFYSGASSKNHFARVERKSEHWFVRYNSSPPGPAVMMPVEMARKYVAWVDKNMVQARINNEDEALWAFIHWHNLDEWHCVPTLVQHVGNERSSIGYNSAGKVSPHFIGENFSGLSIDWTPSANILRIDDKYVNPNSLKAMRVANVDIANISKIDIVKRFL